MRSPSVFFWGVVLVAGAACGPSRPSAPPNAPAYAARPAPTEEGDDDEDREEEEAPPAGKPHPHHPGSGAKTTSKACKPDLAHCTPIGCAKPRSPHALFNELKRRTKDATGDDITRGNARTITFEQLHALQSAADALLPEPKDLTKEQRDQLVALHVPGGTFGEGTGVRLVGFIAPDNGSPSSGAHEGGIESVNCRLTKPEERDVHVPVVASPEHTECEGVVVEPIPQLRAEHPSWATGPLRQLAQQKKLVMFVGPLFWDNEHKVNPDCGHPRTGQPRRMSLWEIHPVTELYVCDSGTCTADDKTGWRKVD
jgi:hypothetical protein